MKTRFLSLSASFLLVAGTLLARDPSVTDDPVMLSPEQSQQTITLPPGYEINLFASEQDFPINNPVAIKWDNRGRLWVANNPTYPHIRPDQDYQDSIVILEDTDQDGKADTYKVFADKLYLPIGFVIGDGGAYVSQEPNLVHLIDTDGDDVADERRVILHGFGSEDSHHAISAFQWAPDGSFYMTEGTFLVSNVETPWGPKRTHDSAVFRFKPGTHQLDIFSNYGWSNPWGITFDRWGTPLLLDASPGRNYYLPHLMGNFAYEDIPPTEAPFTGKKIEELSFFKKGRPNSGAEFISSRNFPEEVQGTYLNGQCIGFHGLRWIWLEEKGSTYHTYKTNNFLQATDTTFRPVDIVFGPDGGMYVLDYYNPIVGHMQYVFRDERRDSSHGRIWRIVNKERPLDPWPRIAGAPVGKLLDLLKHPVMRVRFHARRELQERPWPEVAQPLALWIGNLDASEPDHDLHLLEGFWIYQGHDHLPLPLLEKLLNAKEPNVRASATRAMRFELRRVRNPMQYLTKLAVDPHMRVRLEAVNALSFMDSTEAATWVLKAAEQPIDGGLYWAMKRALQYLAHFGPIPGFEDSIFAIRDLKDPELTQRIDRKWSELAGFEALTRNLSPQVHEKVISRFQKEYDAGRAETLLKVAREVPRTGKADVSGIARRLAAIAPKDAAEGEKAFGRYIRSDHESQGSPTLREAVYAGLMLAGQNGFRDAAELARQRGELAQLMGGASWLRHQPTLRQLFPQLTQFIHHTDGIPADHVRDAMTGVLRVKELRPDVFKELAALAESGVYQLRRGAIGAMYSLAYRDWPKGFDQYAAKFKIDRKKLNLGRQIYNRENYCGQCHMRNGEGVEGAFPPLAASQWVEGDVERLIKVGLYGLEGPLEVHGIAYNAAMPPMGGLLNDEEMAAVLTYIRTAWDNTGSEITAEQVRNVRARIGEHPALMKVNDLMKTHPIPGWENWKKIPARISEFE